MIGKKIKFIRMKKNLNQREFAKATGISKSALSNYERELNMIPASFLINLIKKYKLDANIFAYDNIFEKYKDDLTNSDFKILTEFSVLYTEMVKCFSKMTFEQQGLPEQIEAGEIKLKELIDKINLINKNLNLNLEATEDVQDLLNSLKDLDNSLNIFLNSNSKSNQDIKYLLVSIDEKIQKIRFLFEP